MRKNVLSIVLVIVLMLSILVGLTACGNENTSESKNNESIKNEKVEDENKSISVKEKDGKKGKSKTKESDSEVKLEDIEKDVFNKKFTEYEGKQKANSVRDLLYAVISSNKTNNNKVVIEMNGSITSDITQITGLRNRVAANKNYEVSFEYDDNGLVEKIIIK